jgi:hypothetical protein
VSSRKKALLAVVHKPRSTCAPAQVPNPPTPALPTAVIGSGSVALLTALMSGGVRSLLCPARHGCPQERATRTASVGLQQISRRLKMFL